MNKLLLSLLFLPACTISCVDVPEKLEALAKRANEFKDEQLEGAQHIFNAFKAKVERKLEERKADRFVDKQNSSYQSLQEFPACAHHVAGKLRFCLANRSDLNPEDQEYFNSVCNGAVKNFNDCVERAQREKEIAQKEATHAYFEQWKSKN